MLVLTLYRSSLMAGQPTTVSVLARVQTPEASTDGSPRKALRRALVIDRPGSMSGKPLKGAKRCARQMVDSLATGDRASIVVRRRGRARHAVGSRDERTEGSRRRSAPSREQAKDVATADGDAHGRRNRNEHATSRGTCARVCSSAAPGAVPATASSNSVVKINDHHGAVIALLDRAFANGLCGLAPSVAPTVTQRGLYAVVADDGSIRTVGRRTRRVWNS